MHRSGQHFPLIEPTPNTNYNPNNSTNSTSRRQPSTDSGKSRLRKIRAQKPSARDQND